MRNSKREPKKKNKIMPGPPPIIKTEQQWIIAIDAKISHLQQASRLLSGGGAKRVISSEGRARISAGMKKKWAERRKGRLSDSTCFR
jgi:hypothetical protein